MKKVSWNPMLNFISEIKTAYRKKFKREPSLSYNRDIYRSCVEVWVEELGIQKYIDNKSEKRLCYFPLY